MKGASVKTCKKIQKEAFRKNGVVETHLNYKIVSILHMELKGERQEPQVPCPFLGTTREPAALSSSQAIAMSALAFCAS